MKQVINISNTVSLDNANTTYQTLRRMRIAKVTGFCMNNKGVYVDFKMVKNRNDDEISHTARKIIYILGQNSDVKKMMKGEIVHQWKLDDTNPDYLRVLF